MHEWPSEYNDMPSDRPANDEGPSLAPPEIYELSAADEITAPDWHGDGGTDGSEPPHDDPPAEATPREPGERGKALQYLCNYAQVADEEIHQDIISSLSADPSAAEEIQRLATENGWPLDYAMEVAASYYESTDSDQTLNDKLTYQAISFATLQYNAALKITGLKITPGNEGPELTIVDPELFTAALNEAAVPPDEQARAALYEQTTSLIDKALIAACSTYMAEYHIDGRLFPAPSEDPSAEKIDYASQVADNALAMAQSLTDLGAPPHTVNAVQQLGLAHAGGLEALWAEGYDQWLIGNEILQFGTERTSTVSQITHAEEYLQRLVRAAPEAPFTQNVLKTLKRDIAQALPDVHDRNTPSATQEQLDELRAILGLSVNEAIATRAEKRLRRLATWIDQHL